MKIKAVCEMTGLTDRAVRYYIEEQLISPEYTENYLGRKSFEFTEDDVQQLQDISVLRKFGFSIAEIKEMYANPDLIFPIAKSLQQRKQTIIEEENNLLKALSQLDEDHCYSLSELAECLSAPVVNEPVPAEDSKLNILKIVLEHAKSLLLAIATWMPVGLFIAGVIRCLRANRYPVPNPRAIIFILIVLAPSLALVLLPKLKSQFSKHVIVKVILVVLCILSIPFSFLSGILISSRSETSDIRNYRVLDVNCFAHQSSFYQELFPARPHYFVNEQQPDGSWETVYLDAHYFYRYMFFMDYTYDIYAEWPLDKETFHEEVSRVQDLYNRKAAGYTTMQKGNYTCLIKFYGDQPFTEVTNNYTYYIFAYDEENLTVRYILCDSLSNGVDQPYYLSLDW